MSDATPAHDHCDACGQETTVADVWVNKATVARLCHRCPVAALTAEGERHGDYFGWGEQ